MARRRNGRFGASALEDAGSSAALGFSLQLFNTRPMSSHLFLRLESPFQPILSCTACHLAKFSCVHTCGAASAYAMTFADELRAARTAVGLGLHCTLHHVACRTPSLLLYEALHATERRVERPTKQARLEAHCWCQRIAVCSWRCVAGIPSRSEQLEHATRGVNSPSVGSSRWCPSETGGRSVQLSWPRQG